MRGSTLIEAMIAIVVIGFTLVLFQYSIKNVPLARSESNRDIALKAARAELEELRLGGYAALPGNSTFTQPALSAFSSSTGALTVTVYNAKTKQVTATVYWYEGSLATTSSVSLTTLITEAGGL